jgi:hypothetical protein
MIANCLLFILIQDCFGARGCDAVGGVVAAPVRVGVPGSRVDIRAICNNLRIDRACQCGSLLYWNQPLLPIYFQHVFEQPVAISRVPVCPQHVTLTAVDVYGVE